MSTLKRSNSSASALSSLSSSGGLDSPAIESTTRTEWRATMEERTLRANPSVSSGARGGPAKDLGSFENLSQLPKTTSRENSHTSMSRPNSREGSMQKMSRNDSAEEAMKEVTKVAHGQANHKAITRVEFKVRVTTNPGDRVVVTGSVQELGFWEPRNGIELKTTKDTYPIWAALHHVPSGESVEYKYVIIRGGEDSLVWESSIDNRMFTAEGMVLVLDDGTFNQESAKLLNKDFVSVERGHRMKKATLHDVVANIEQSDTIYVIANRLPLICNRDPETRQVTFQWLSFALDAMVKDAKVMRSMSRHAGYVVENLRELRSRCRVVFVGGLGLDVPEEEQEALSQELMDKFQCVPVYLEKQMQSEYEDFCHNVLKPIFHFVHPTSADICRAFAAEAKWQMYSQVNLEYVKPVVQNFNDGDCVFVFDLGLMMAPTLIGSRARTANICFFFNTPFPSSEIFRTMPVRKQALQSLLNADFITFHCFTYARHFLSCCSSLLGLENRPARGGLVNLVFNGHHVHVRASHVGIDAATICRRLSEERVKDEFENWKKEFASLNRSIILVGYDDMEPLSGITLKLRAVQSMLKVYPEYQQSLVLVQVAIGLHDSRGEMMHREYVEEVHRVVQEINAQFPGTVLLKTEKMPFAPRVALFAMSDVLVNSAVRHGLSLVPVEYVLAGNAVGGKQGALLLSEFTACSKVIPGVIRTNPWREEDFARSIVKSLRQRQHEREHWNAEQLAWCKHNTVLRWAENILEDMKRVRAHMVEMGEDIARSACCRVGLVKSSYKEISSNILRPAEVNSAYHACKTRLVLLDLDLLRPTKEELEELGDASWQQTLGSIELLLKEAGNCVFLLSSDSPEKVLNMLKRMKGIDKLGLAAEDGYYYKWPGSPRDRWDQRQHVVTQWKEVCSALMHTYAERTTGTYVQDDQVASITWHFGVSNPDFARMQAKELLNHLNDTLAHLPVEVVVGKSFVRVRHQGVTKGNLVSHIIQHYSSRGGVDFLLCLGDDRIDEDMFNTLKDYQQAAQYRQFEGHEQEIKVFTCTVGRQPAVASYCLYTHEEVQEVLSQLSLQSKRKMRSAATMLGLSSLQ